MDHNNSACIFWFFGFFFYVLGAASDMESSTKLARAMVTMYGMSDKVMLDLSTPFLSGEEFSLFGQKTMFLPTGLQNRELLSFLETKIPAFSLGKVGSIYVSLGWNDSN